LKLASLAPRILAELIRWKILRILEAFDFDPKAAEMEAVRWLRGYPVIRIRRKMLPSHEDRRFHPHKDVSSA
jgi:hypothetical protein